MSSICSLLCLSVYPGERGSHGASPIKTGAHGVPRYNWTWRASGVGGRVLRSRFPALRTSAHLWLPRCKHVARVRFWACPLRNIYSRQMKTLEFYISNLPRHGFERVSASECQITVHLLTTFDAQVAPNWTKAFENTPFLTNIVA